ncbi:hypothetical protein PMZ80_001709 [Knufia obscura]|uniref:Uncharacterized protein n=1 Tax=Knufia obscura TaxID=1635080 RepID=A0ABR0S3X4_9EURO|nr:hypothetical protein PMZ80_001709 [Knufia obscura]
MQRHNLDPRAEVSIQHDRDGGISNAFSSPQKRKHQGGSTANSAKIQTKRRKTADIAAFEAEEEHISTIEQHRDRALLLRVIYGLARTKDKLPSGDERKDSIIHLACDSIIETCQKAQDETTSKTANQSESLTFNEACVAARKIWSTLLAKLRSHSTLLSGPIDDHLSAVDAAICSIVEYFLSRLHQYCLDEADRRAELSRKSTKARKPNTKAALRNAAERVELFKHNCNIITCTLAYMLAATVSLQASHQRLFDAIASVFLEHLGSAMSLHLFGDPRNPKDRQSLAPPRGIQDVSHIETGDAFLTTQLEAPYLVSILKGLMSSGTSSRHTAMDDINPGNSLGTKISPIVLHRLQGRLIRGIFDDETKIYANDNARDEQLPSVDLAEQQAVDEVKANDEDWFLSQVWDLLGWDILLQDKDNSNLAEEVDIDT